MASATSRALSTAELLQTILLLTDTRTLLLSQRVSREWRDLIRDSKPLRQALFLEPVGIIDRELDVFPQCSKHRAKGDPVITHNPLMPPAVQILGLNQLRKYTSEEFQAGDVPYLGWESRSASFSNMLITQPAVKAVRIWVAERRAKDSRKRYSNPEYDTEDRMPWAGCGTWVRAPQKGVTMGNIIDNLKCCRDGDEKLDFVYGTTRQCMACYVE